MAYKPEYYKELTNVKYPMSDVLSTMKLISPRKTNMTPIRNKS